MVSNATARTNSGANPSTIAAANGHHAPSYASDQMHGRFPRISRPVELLRPEYDVVVVGSGYGGGVAASRMARGRQSVCLLELGKEKWPGEYPTKFVDAMKEVHVSGDFAPGSKRGRFVEEGDPTGLYHLVVGEGQNAFVGNGLGGTSLLNANVFLEAYEGVLNMDVWPEELKGRDAWEKYYSLARGVLEPVPYPSQFPDLPKLNLLQKQAQLLGLGDKFYRVPQTTRFVDGPNSTGVEMKASTLTGMDPTGVNDGSKSSTLVNYLSDAWNWGAEIFCECQVRYIKKAPQGEGYIVYFAWHGGKRGAFKKNMYEDLMWVRAKKCVFLGAGSFGTTEILLRSKQMGLGMSNCIGTGMSGNGDILAFGYNTDYYVNSIGRPFPFPERPIGPCITGIIDCRDQPNPLDGFVIEEGTVPEALAPFFEAMLDLMPGKTLPTELSAYDKVKRSLAQQGSKLLGPYFPKGSVERTQVYLIMSHDSNQAVLTLENDKPKLEFLGVGRSEHVTELNGILAKATTAVGGTFEGNPFYATLGQQEITVHLIGGASISKDGTGASGGTNHMGEVFTGNGATVHEDLVVCDGALVPAALGVNPFATITALAERSVELVAKKRGIKIDLETKNGTLDLFGKPAFPVLDQVGLDAVENIIAKAADDATSGIGFTEVMSGFIHIGDDDTGDFQVATEIAESNCEAARFFLSVKSWNTQDLVSSSAHSATLTGTFSCARLQGPFMVERGEFQLFNKDPERESTKNLTYDFDMINPNGDSLHFHGYKIVSPSVAFDPARFWKATSTLYVTITDENKVVGRGTLHIQPEDFVSELATLETTGTSVYARLGSAISFFSYFARQSAGVFFAPFSLLQWPAPTPKVFKNVKKISKTIDVVASDGIHSTMQMWNPDADTSSVAAPVILFIPGAAVGHEIFALPTIETNAIDYFCRWGYRCFCVTHRVGKTMNARKGFTTFDARLDIVAALAHIRKSQSVDKVYVIAHCAGSVALACGLLDGTIPASWISGITASNVFMNPMFAKTNVLKARAPIPMNKLYRNVVGTWFSCISSPDDSLVQRVLNQLLRLYPVGPRSEICNSTVCHRSELVFGRLWTHTNLNAATHDALENFVDGTSMSSLGYLMFVGRKGYVTTNLPTAADLVTPRNIQRLRGIPILLFSGSDNAVYTPENTDASYSLLRDTNGPDDYERLEFEGRGHLDCWMGNTAWRDVYPRVRRHVDQVVLPRAR